MNNGLGRMLEVKRLLAANGKSATAKAGAPGSE